MDFYQALSILTSVTSTVTMILVAVAVVPHIKQGLAVIRDAILWVTFVLVVTLGIWLGWQRLSSRETSPAAERQPEIRPTATRATTVRERRVGWSGDPYYRGALDQTP